jgi:hypothetical protein
VRRLPRFPRSGAALVSVLLGLMAVSAANPLSASAAAGAARPPAAAKPAKPAGHALAHARRPLARAASCYAPLTGDWRNINSATTAMTRVVVDFTCGDVVLCDTSGHCTGGDSYYAMHPFGRCHPTDCDWGRLRATDMGGGWIESTYNFGFKTSSVWLKTYDYYGLTYLRVWVYNDFASWDGRTDYTTDEWMLR